MSTTFTLTPEQIVFSALRVFNAIALGATLDSNTLDNGIQVLNMMLKGWQTQGFKIWTIEELVITPILSQASYTIGPSGTDIIANKPLRLINGLCFSRDTSSNLDRSITVLSKNEYMLLGDKSATGSINSVMYDPGVSTGTVYVYNTADNYAVANTTLHLFSQRPIQDINLSTDPFDFPQEWLMALRWNLAAELMSEYGVEMNQQQAIEMKAAKYKSELEDWDTEHTSVYFNPDIRSGFIRM